MLIDQRTLHGHKRHLCFPGLASPQTTDTLVHFELTQCVLEVPFEQQRGRCQILRYGLAKSLSSMLIPSNITSSKSRHASGHWCDDTKLSLGTRKRSFSGIGCEGQKHQWLPQCCQSPDDLQETVSDPKQPESGMLMERSRINVFE